MAHSLSRASCWPGTASMLSRPATSWTRTSLPPAFLIPSCHASSSRAINGVVLVQRHHRFASSSSSTSSSSSSRPSVSVRSSSSTSASSPSSSSSRSTSGSASIPERTDKLNPPASTLPPALEDVTRKPDQSTAGYWYAIGKSYLTFFKSGIKAVWSNHTQSRAVLAQHSLPKNKADGALDSGALSRSDWQLVRRAQRDIWRLPAFGLVLFVFGEFTVLLLPVVGGIVPRTCWVPRQVSHHRGKVEARRARSFRRGDSVADVGELVLADGGATLDTLRHAQRLHAGRSLGLYSAWWDTLWDYPPGFVLNGRLRRWAEYVERDDKAIVRYGGVQKLQEDELRIAAEERGLDVLGKTMAQLQQTLERWLKEKGRQGVWNLVLTRPSVWDRKAT